ncbi:hypothetical protein ACJJTC_011872 [Scirpophaga incertulas]
MTCNACKNAYHFQCLNITSAQFSNLAPAFLASWICPACNNVTRRGPKSNVETPVRKTQLMAQSEDSMNMSSDLHNISVGALALSQLAVTLQASLRKEIREAIKAEVESEFNRIKGDLTLSTDFLSAEQTELKTKMQINADLVKSLESQNEARAEELRC